MGCHTWFYVPYENNKELTIQKAQEWLNSKEADYIDDDHRKMYQYAINAQLCNVCCKLAYLYPLSCINIGWQIYIKIDQHVLNKYNEEHNTNYESLYSTIEDKDLYELLSSELYGDCPRIGGYPENIIKSYDEMVEFINTGYTDEDGEHYDFYHADEVLIEDKEALDRVLKVIKEFFTKHPQGVITFG